MEVKKQDDKISINSHDELNQSTYDIPKNQPVLPKKVEYHIITASGHALGLALSSSVLLSWSHHITACERA